MSLPEFDENRRLARVTALQALQKAHPSDFSDVVTLGRMVLKVPILSVSLIDGDYQHHIAAHGLGLDRVPRDQTFCTYTIRSDVVMVVSDTLQDPLFAQHPFVTGKPHLRFYAGAPMIYEPGVRLGTVCAADVRPRHLTPGKLLFLEHLARVAVGRIRAMAESRPAGWTRPTAPAAPECALPSRGPVEVRRRRA